MQAKITIDMGNAAFEGNGPGYELAAILEGLLQTIRDGGDECYLFDSNGNRVGFFKIVGGRK
jgi:hypothetical protein